MRACACARRGCVRVRVRATCYAVQRAMRKATCSACGGYGSNSAPGDIMIDVAEGKVNGSGADEVGRLRVRSILLYCVVLH